jgi:DNA polymerase-3 subunit gamma/tau
MDLFHNLQESLQPRMHLELGLVKLVHAGRLKPIEEFLAQVQSGGALPPPPPAPATGSTPRQAPPARFAAPASAPAPVAPPPPPAPVPAVPSASGDLKARLLHTLNEKGMTFIADAVEHSNLVERPGEIEFLTSKEFSMAIKSKDMLKEVEAVLKRPTRIKVTLSDAAPNPEPTSAVDRRTNEDEATRRALDNPEVQRFRELFPGSEVRAVRNLKETQ